MRYYFHIREGTDVEIDEEGTDLPSIDAAHEEAREAAPEIVSEMVRGRECIDGKTFEVTDETGRVTTAIPFASVVRLDSTPQLFWCLVRIAHNLIASSFGIYQTHKSMASPPLMSGVEVDRFEQRCGYRSDDIERGTSLALVRLVR